jgi:hypothetical protein
VGGDIFGLTSDKPFHVVPATGAQAPTGGNARSDVDSSANGGWLRDALNNGGRTAGRKSEVAFSYG